MPIGPDATYNEDMSLQRTISASIRPEEQYGYVAECSFLHLVTQGGTLDEVVANLQEAVALALDDEDLEALGLEDQHEAG